MEVVRLTNFSPKYLGFEHRCWCDLHNGAFTAFVAACSEFVADSTAGSAPVTDTPCKDSDDAMFLLPTSSQKAVAGSSRVGDETAVEAIGVPLEGAAFGESSKGGSGTSVSYVRLTPRPLQSPETPRGSSTRLSNAASEWLAYLESSSIGSFGVSQSKKSAPSSRGVLRERGLLAVGEKTSAVVRRCWTVTLLTALPLFEPQTTVCSFWAAAFLRVVSRPPRPLLLAFCVILIPWGCFVGENSIEKFSFE
nr:hypothetical protein Iba_chr02aCG10540 [Ipomoea batatas]